MAWNVVKSQPGVTSFFKKILLFMYLSLAVLGLHCGLGSSLAAGHRLQIAVVSPVAEYGLQGIWAFVAAAHGLSSCLLLSSRAQTQ